MNSLSTYKESSRNISLVLEDIALNPENYTPEDILDLYAEIIDLLFECEMVRSRLVETRQTISNESSNSDRLAPLIARYLLIYDVEVESQLLIVEDLVAFLDSVLGVLEDTIGG